MSEDEVSRLHGEVERLRAEVQRLEEAVARRDRFVSSVGHELRNPLAPVFLQAQYLLEVAESSPEEITPEWLVPKLQKFVQRFRKLMGGLNRILDVSRLSTGRYELEVEEVDLATAVREVCEELEPEVTAAKIALAIDAPAPVIGKWDRLRVEQIVMNLVSNAIRYGAGRPVEVEVRADSADVARIAVADHGVGIAEQDRERIFDRFERAASRRSGAGFGVGLWLVKELAAAMGGRVDLESRVGEGSTFTVRLPRNGNGAQLKQASSSGA